MKFVTLDNALNAMVALAGHQPTLDFLKLEVRLYDPGYRDSDSEYRAICHRSYMAGLLHQLITNAAEEAAPRWARQHEVTGRPVLDQSLRTGALEYLEKMASYVLEEYNAAVKIGPKGLSIERSRIVKYPDPRVKIFMPKIEKFAVVEGDLIRLLESAGFNLPFDADGNSKPSGNASGATAPSMVDVELVPPAAAASLGDHGRIDGSAAESSGRSAFVTGLEASDVREDRRLARLQEHGGDRVRNGAGWKATGKRGALARLVEEEAAAGRPYSDERDVRRDLDAAAERRHAGRTMPKG